MVDFLLYFEKKETSFSRPRYHLSSAQIKMCSSIMKQIKVNSRAFFPFKKDFDSCYVAFCYCDNDTCEACEELRPIVTILFCT